VQSGKVKATFCVHGQEREFSKKTYPISCFNSRLVAPRYTHQMISLNYYCVLLFISSVDVPILKRTLSTIHTTLAIEAMCS
jgi:hypothetical protein